jgi:cytochrome c-type biogenesis protein CcmH/NrfG
MRRRLLGDVRCFALVVLIAQVPASSDVATVLADARKLIDAGQAAAAIAKLKDAGDDPRVAELLGVAYYHANDAARAMQQLEPLLERLPRDSAERREAVQVLGLSHYLAGHIAQAIPYLE